MSRFSSVLVGILLLGHWPASARGVEIDFVPVGTPGNAADPQTGQGAVGYAYAIDRYEVTTRGTPSSSTPRRKPTPPGLFNINMQLDPSGGINRGGEEGGFVYTVKPGYANKPVGWVTWYDEARFTNWLHNGQGNGDTETGTYTFPNTSGNPFAAIARNPGARVFLPSRDEWSRRHTTTRTSRAVRATGTTRREPTPRPYSDQPPGAGAPTPANTANFFKDDGRANGYDDGYAVTGSPEFSFDVNLLTDVGAYAQSASAYGTFDQGGNVWEYDERIRTSVTRIFRGISGGNFASFEENLSAGGVYIDQNANSEIGSIGFRVAAVLEPATAGVITSLAALLLMRRRRMPRPRA